MATDVSEDRNTFIFAPNSVSAEDEGFNISRNVGNHTTVVLRIQVLGRVATDVSKNRNAFRVEEYLSRGRRLYYLLKRRKPHNCDAEDSSSRASVYRCFGIPLYLASNSISAEDEDSTTSRNVGNHTTVMLRIQVLGRVVTDVSKNRNTFIFSVKQCFS